MASNYSTNQESETADEGSPNPSLDGGKFLKDILSALFGVAPKWYNFGLALLIDKDELEIIKTNHPQCKARLQETISCWLRTCESPKWELLVEALCSPKVNCRELARKIQNTYCPQYQLPSGQCSPVTIGEDALQPQTTIMSPTGLFPYELKWKKGKSALIQMSAPIGAVVHGDTAYFREYRSREIFSFNSQSQEWQPLPDCRVRDTSLVVFPVTDTCTELALCTIGGIKRQCDREHKDDIHTNALFQLQLDEMKWVPLAYCPTMLTKRSQVTAVYTDQMLIVAGGRNSAGVLAIVEVFNIDHNTWYNVSPLPSGVYRASGCVCQQKLFILGGYNMNNCAAPIPVRTAYEVDLHILKQACTTHVSPDITIPHKSITVPLNNSTFVSVNGFILAIGGSELNTCASSQKVHSYHPLTESWHHLKTSSLLEKRCFPFSVVFDKGESVDIAVVGGYTVQSDVDCTDSMEVATLTKDVLAIQAREP